MLCFRNIASLEQIGFVESEGSAEFERADMASGLEILGRGKRIGFMCRKTIGNDVFVHVSAVQKGGHTGLTGLRYELILLAAMARCTLRICGLGEA